MNVDVDVGWQCVVGIHICIYMVDVSWRYVLLEVGMLIRVEDNQATIAVCVVYSCESYAYLVKKGC